MQQLLDKRILAEILRRRGDRTLEEITKAICKKTNLTKSGVASFISKLQSGEIFGSSIRYKRNGAASSTLRNLAVYLDYLGFKEDEETILAIRSYEPSFEYPISSSQKSKKQYARA